LFYIELFDFEQINFSFPNMDTMSVFFGCDDLKRLRYTLNYGKEHSKKIEVIVFETSKSNLNNECEKYK
jgi:hypothetical protein